MKILYLIFLIPLFYGCKITSEYPRNNKLDQLQDGILLVFDACSYISKKK